MYLYNQAIFMYIKRWYTLIFVVWTDFRLGLPLNMLAESANLRCRICVRIVQNIYWNLVVSILFTNGLKKFTSPYELSILFFCCLTELLIDSHPNRHISSALIDLRLIAISFFRYQCLILTLLFYYPGWLDILIQFLVFSVYMLSGA